MMEIRNLRPNGWGNLVVDAYWHGRFLATLEDTERGLRVLLGAMQPAGKAIVRELIDARD